MQIEELSLSAIKPYEKNPRKNDEAVAGVAESIKKFGFQQPIVIDAKGVIVVGHTRYKAAKKLGLKTVPCVRASELTKEQVKAYRILDNKLNEVATWDFEALADELKSFSFDFSGFEVNFPKFYTEPVVAPSFSNSPGSNFSNEEESKEDVVSEVSETHGESSTSSAPEGWEGMPSFHSEDQTVPILVVNFRQNKPVYAA